jgi:hypothetical protein
MSREAWCFWAAISTGAFFGGIACGGIGPVNGPLVTAVAGASGMIACLLVVYRIDDREFWEGIRRKVGAAGLNDDGSYRSLDRDEEDAIEAYYRRKCG